MIIFGKIMTSNDDKTESNFTGINQASRLLPYTLPYALSISTTLAPDLSLHELSYLGPRLPVLFGRDLLGLNMLKHAYCKETLRSIFAMAMTNCCHQVIIHRWMTRAKNKSHNLMSIMQGVRIMISTIGHLVDCSEWISFVTEIASR